MTYAEKLIVSSYTEFLMVDFDDVHHFCKNLLGIPLFTHDFAERALYDIIRGETKDWFLKICEDQFTKEDEKAVLDILEGKNNG